MRFLSFVIIGDYYVEKNKSDTEVQKWDRMVSLVRSI